MNITLIKPPLHPLATVLNLPLMENHGTVALLSINIQLVIGDVGKLLRLFKIWYATIPALEDGVQEEQFST